MDQLDMAHKGKEKHPFNSDVPRIIGTHVASDIPGPGAYNPLVNNYNLKTIKQKRKVQYDGYDWIIGQPRTKGLSANENNKNVGPDTYQVQISSKSPKYSWGKSNRFEEKPLKPTHIGPGYYKIEEKAEVPGASAVFRSRVPKLIDNNDSDKSFSLKQKSTNQLLESISKHSIQNNSQEMMLPKNKHEKSSFFGSKVPRFEQKDQSPTKDIGPGAYQLEKDDIRIKKKKSKPMQQLNHGANHHKQQIILGPGSYDLSNYTLGNQLNKKGYAISRETRFNFKTKKTASAILPGPGQYMEKKYLYADRQELFKDLSHQNRKSKSISHAALKEKSLSKKHQMRETPDFYDVKVFDMSYELQKKKWYYDNLKELKVELAPFNSKVNRLS